MFRPTLWLPSPRYTFIDVTSGQSEVEKCSAVKSTTSGNISSDRDGALCSRRWSGWWGWGLALDHSDTSHSSLRCIYSVLSEQQRCIIDPYNWPHTRIFPHFYVFTDLCKSFRQAAGWILLGSCSAPQWPCLYMSCRSRHCWRRRSLQMAGQDGKREREEEGVNNGPSGRAWQII